MSTADRPQAAPAWPWVALIVLGVGVVAAPVVFQLFTRAPRGAEMIDGFRPYMDEPTIRGFQDDIAVIRAAVDEGDAQVTPRLEADGLAADPAVVSGRPAYDDLQRRWPEIDADMSDMLRTMHGDLDAFAGVDALPSFTLFPWFFVVPGVLVVGAAGWGLRQARRGRRTRGPVVAVIAIGVGLALAPAAFQMFTRAPRGGEMIDDFRPLMTTEKVQRVQGYFLVLGAGEGTLRNQIVPALHAPEPTLALPAIERLSRRWPTVSNEMAPMIGAMSDNLGNYAAVDALPPFALFPWFFVVPGALVVVLGLLAARFREPGAVPVPPSQEPTMTRTSKARPSKGASITTLVIVLGLLGAAGCSSDDDSGSGTTTSSAPSDRGELVGVFEVDTGECAAGAVESGSYFRMVASGGTVDAGPYVANADSACGDKNFTALVPGTDGGLETGEYQPQPDPPFDASQNGLADQIVAPTKFFAVDFAVSTNETDPQSGTAVPAPSITNDGGTLRGDLSAVSVAWNGQQFNQGSPKPGSSAAGSPGAVTGTYDPESGRFTLEWSSVIEGGPFNGFTGVWHLEGTFRRS